MKLRYIIPTIALTAASLGIKAQATKLSNNKEKNKTEIKNILNKNPEITTSASFKDILLQTKTEGEVNDTNKAITIYKKLLVETINNQRKKRNLAPLKEENDLNQAAQKYSERMREHHQRGHEVAGKQVENMGIDLSKYTILLENVAMNSPFISPEKIIEGQINLDYIQDSIQGKKATKPNHDNTLLNKDIDNF